MMFQKTRNSAEDETVKGVLFRGPSGALEYGQFLSRFLKIHPMPKLRSPNESEVFGPLLFDDSIYFRKYDATTECWSIVLALNPAPEPADAEPDEDPEEAAAYDTLLSLPPPAIPNDRDTPHFLEPFRYNGCAFVRVFLPTDGEWKLVLIAQQEGEVPQA